MVTFLRFENCYHCHKNVLIYMENHDVSTKTTFYSVLMDLFRTYLISLVFLLGSSTLAKKKLVFTNFGLTAHNDSSEKIPYQRCSKKPNKPTFRDW